MLTFFAGTLIRRGNKINASTALDHFEDLDAVKQVLVRDREELDSRATVDRYVEGLDTRPFKAFYDEKLEALAIVLPPSDGATLAQLATLTISKVSWLQLGQHLC